MEDYSNRRSLETTAMTIADDHLDVLRTLGVAGWNKWRDENPSIAIKLRRASLYGLFSAQASRKKDGKPIPLKKGVRAALQGIDLSNADLSDTFLEYASLSGANLEGANLEGANLTDAQLGNARLSRAFLRDARLRRAKLNGADLRDADLTYAQLNGCDLSGANLTNANVYGISAWDVTVDGQTNQSNLAMNKYNQPPALWVSDLELAQFLHLMLNHKSIGRVIDAMTARGVLILGRFGGGGIDTLRSIASALRQHEYLPIIFDFERPQNLNYTQTVKTLVGLSRFVIVDLSGPSVPQELYATVPHFNIPFVPIVERGRSTYSMFADLLMYQWVVRPPIDFATPEELVDQVQTIIALAEAACGERQKRLTELFGTSK
jgi:uncharacterized protein YjbI with pentapeptide repeats